MFFKLPPITLPTPVPHLAEPPMCHPSDEHLILQKVCALESDAHAIGETELCGIQGGVVPLRDGGSWGRQLRQNTGGHIACKTKSRQYNSQMDPQ
jgi:hypothetical protein